MLISAYYNASVGPTHVLELIQESPAADMLLPLVTALQFELGQDPSGREGSPGGSTGRHGVNWRLIRGS